MAKTMAAAVPVTPAFEESSFDLLSLAELITTRAHLLAPGNSDEALYALATSVVKASFDRALSSESLSFPHLATLLSSLTQAGPATRSSKVKEAAPVAAMALPLTPLEELTTEGMEGEMVWEQMEMRGNVVVGLLSEMFGAGGDQEGEDEEGGDEEEEDDESEGSVGDLEDEFMSGSEDDEEEPDSDESGVQEDFVEEAAYFRKIAPAAAGAPDDEDDEDELVPGEDNEDPQADVNRSLSLATFDHIPEATARRATGPASAVDDTFFSLHDFHVQTDEGEAEMLKMLKPPTKGGDDESSEEEDEGEDAVDFFKAFDEEQDSDGEELDTPGLMYADFFDPPSKPFVKGKPSKGKGKAVEAPPTKAKASKGKVAKTAEPTAAPKTVTKKRSVRFSESVKVKEIAPRGSEFDKLVAKVGYEKAEAMMAESEKSGSSSREDEEVFGAEGEEDLVMGDYDPERDGEGDDGDSDEEEDEEEEGEEDDEEEYESEDDEGQETIARLKSSLFDEEEPDEDSSTPAASLSRHERRLLALSSQIAQLEAENVGVKDWATKGEAKAKDRPVNSLLEEDLEYERAGKVVPVMGEEATKTIEELIKKRILDNMFDDVVRQREIDPNKFLPSRFMEIQDVKSSKSLAEIYEEDYVQAREKDAGREVVKGVDKDLEKKHLEIEELFEELASRLDALSNARFTPKPPKATITTITNVASITLESALPTTTSVSTLLAPEEVFVPDPTNVDRSDFTPAMKKTARQKRRKARAAIAKNVEKFQKGVKGQKERAVKELVGTRGVTVVGKGGKVEGGTKRKRSDGDEGGQSGIRLKL